ncbi:MAG: pyridoxal phosphate-dependent aminotransferase, partial [Chloroflexota bacterium]
RLDTAVETIRSLRPALVFLCNPNNPTGVLLGPEELERIADATGDGLLVLDEAYIPLSDSPWDAAPLLEGGNVALLRSMTKDHALAGVRLGYLLAMEQVIKRVRRLQPSWSVSSIAQAAGVAALSDHGHVKRAREAIARGKACLERDLKRLGVPALPSSANFLLSEVGDAAGLRSAMLRRGVCVRDCASFGLPRHIRISVRTPEECRHFVDALEDAFEERSAGRQGNGAEE